MITQKRGQITIDGLVVPDVEAIMCSVQEWIAYGVIYEPPLGMSQAEKERGRQIILSEPTNEQ